MPTLLLTHPACLEHDTGYGHPERADRLRAIDDALDAPAFKVLKREEAPLADLADIERLHPQSYVEMVKSEIPQHDHNWLDPDTVVSPGSWEAALRAAGACALRRRSGHGGKCRQRLLRGASAGPSCRAVPRHGLLPVQQRRHRARSMRAPSTAPSAWRWSISTCITATARRPRSGPIRICSTARRIRCRSFPAPARSSETGVGNICQRAAAAGRRRRSVPRGLRESHPAGARHNFAPDFLLVSAGFDAHIRDPLAQLRLVEPDFAWVTEKLLEAADKHCGGKLVSTLEGGYDLDALANSTAVHVQTLMAAAS